MRVSRTNSNQKYRGVLTARLPMECVSAYEMAWDNRAGAVDSTHYGREPLQLTTAKCTRK
jgi:hypothetical protein